MTIEQLTYIVEVAKTKSLAKASQRLNISQSALSQAITKLEAELNLKLFIRNRTGAIVTKEGAAIVEKAEQALHSVYLIKEEVKKQLNSVADSLTISVIPGLISPLIETYLSLKNLGLELLIDIDEKGSMEIIEEIKNDKADLGFIAINDENMDQTKGLEFSPVMEGKLLIYASEDSPLKNSKTRLTAETLINQTFVLYKDDEYVQSFISHLQRRYSPVNIFFKTTNLDVIRKAVIELGALTVGHDVSAIYSPDIHSDQIIALDIPDNSDSRFTFGWIQKKENTLSEQAQLFVDEVNEFLIQNKKELA